MSNCILQPANLITCLIYLILCMSLAIAAIYVAYQHIKNYRKTPALMFWIGLFFTTTIILTGINNTSATIQVIRSCYKISKLQDRISIIIYVLAWYSLSLSLFSRIYIVFKGSTFQLSSFTVYTVCFYFVFQSLLIVIGFLPIWGEHYNFVYLLIGIMYLSAIIYIIWITAFFIYKLFKVFKNSNPELENDALLSVITKNTLLAIISIFATFVSIIIWIFVVSLRQTRSNSDGQMTAVRYIYYFGYLIDAYTNFICITLTYKLFSNHYKRFCRTIDKKCRLCCLHSVGKSVGKPKLEVSSYMSNTPNIDKTKSISIGSTSPRSIEKTMSNSEKDI